jgi:hypothetical protein
MGIRPLGVAGGTKLNVYRGVLPNSLPTPILHLVKAYSEQEKTPPERGFLGVPEEGFEPPTRGL